jgi:hypothetical protein
LLLARRCTFAVVASSIFSPSPAASSMRLAHPRAVEAVAKLHLAGQIVAAVADGGLTRTELAARVGRKTNDGTFSRGLSALLPFPENRKEIQMQRNAKHTEAAKAKIAAGQKAAWDRRKAADAEMRAKLAAYEAVGRAT